MTETPAVYAASEPERHPYATVVMDQRWSKLLARLQQVANRGGVVTVDLDAWTVEEHGRKEHLAPRVVTG